MERNTQQLTNDLLSVSQQQKEIKSPWESEACTQRERADPQSISWCRAEVHELLASSSLMHQLRGESGRRDTWRSREAPPLEDGPLWVFLLLSRCGYFSSR